MIDFQENLDLLDLKKRAQLLRDAYARLSTILEVYCSGYLMIPSDPLDEAYIRLRRLIDNLLKTKELETIRNDFPTGIIPQSLHSLGEEADIFWDYARNQIMDFKGKVLEFCLVTGAGYGDSKEIFEKEAFDSYDRFIASYKNQKSQIEKRWLESTKSAGQAYQKQFSKSHAVNPYVNLERIEQMEAIRSGDYDLTKLIELCKEINVNFSHDSFIAVAMLVRSVLDHVPPIFGRKTFSEVSNNYTGGSKSFKQSMQHLDISSRKIADSYLHTQIRKSEVLPNKTQVNFSNDLDVLLAEIIRLLK